MSARHPSNYRRRLAEERSGSRLGGNRVTKCSDDDWESAMTNEVGCPFNKLLIIRNCL